MDDLMSRILSDESVLRVKDVENVRRKISRILEGGVEKLHVISGKRRKCRQFVMLHSCWRMSIDSGKLQL